MVNVEIEFFVVAITFIIPIASPNCSGRVMNLICAHGTTVWLVLLDSAQGLDL